MHMCVCVCVFTCLRVLAVFVTLCVWSQRWTLLLVLTLQRFWWHCCDECCSATWVLVLHLRCLLVTFCVLLLHYLICFSVVCCSVLLLWHQCVTILCNIGNILFIFSHVVLWWELTVGRCRILFAAHLSVLWSLGFSVVNVYDDCWQMFTHCLGWLRRLSPRIPAHADVFFWQLWSQVVTLTIWHRSVGIL